ncbi:TPA: LysR family transcriptional regulator [Klebsiella pneumoniae]|uniref:LysR substrate-binding domain-containing protein n=1 Tax=Klebsiella pneumoniae TaxID=573 RepID=UPI001FA9DF82|nr:LysR substrate-binding domain-containing protein [Klebsiella pneumoniae]HCI5703148.1 LysR family transcriptional regulator [Klebsiella pneumoniae]
MLLRQLSYFIAVAEHCGFSRAAAALHVSQPALSQQIRQLEAMLEVQLFDRSGRRIRLTDAGEIWLEYARRALRELEEGRRALHDAEDLQHGKLRIAMTPTFTTYMLGPLMEDELDVGIAFDDSRSQEIVVQPLLTETLALVVSRAHPLAGERDLQLQALDAQPLILLSSKFATREQIDRYCRLHRLEPDVRMEANSIGAVLSVIRSTTLATLLPAAIAGQFDDVVAIELRPALLQRTACLLQRQGAWQSAAAREFITLARENAITIEQENRQSLA